MPKNILKTDETALKAVPKPQKSNSTDGRSYSVVGHDFIINEVRKQLSAYNLTIKEELYVSNLNGQVAQGVYHLNHSTDNELGLMFAWGNSYDKSMRFRCAIGGYVFVCGNGVISGDMSNYGRKHVGEVKDQVTEHIESQIKMASKYYKQLVADKNVMKAINLSNDDICKLLGKLYLKDEVITSSQLIMFKEQLNNPAHDYGTDENCLWTIYNHITYTLKKSHPSKWMDAQKDLHKIVKAMFFPKVAVLDPNQLDLAEEAEKMEALGEIITEDELTSQLYGVNNNEEEITMTAHIETDEEYNARVAEIEGESEEEIEEPTEFSLDDYESEEPVNDLPEITGIPNGNSISDTDDYEDYEPKTDETGLLLTDDFSSCPEPEEDVANVNDVNFESTVNELDDFIVEEQVEEFAEESELTLSLDPEDEEGEDENGHGDVVEYNFEEIAQDVQPNDFNLDFTEQPTPEENLNKGDMESPEFEF